MKQRFFKRNIFARICFGIMLFSSVLSAQSPIFFTDTFNTPPSLASSQTASTWYPDRYPSTIFEQDNVNGENVLHVGIRMADAYLNRPLANQNSFYNTQGRKFDLGSGNNLNTALTADIYIGADWNVKHRMATLWSTACDVNGDPSFYNYMGFRNGTGSAPGLYVFGYHNIGTYTLLPVVITYGQWYSLKIELTDTAFVYYVNGDVVLSDTTLNGTKYFSNLMLQAYNFADATLATESQAFEEYDVYWDNVGAINTYVLQPVDLGTAADFRILANTGITGGAGGNIIGDIGVAAVATTMTGFSQVMDGGGTFSTSASVTGNIYAFNYADPTPTKMTTASNDMGTAYTNAANRTPTPVGPFLNAGNGAGEIGGLNLVPGLYKWTTAVTISNDLTLSGNSTDVWIFQLAQTLAMASGKQIVLSGGAHASNVFWQVAGQVSLIGTAAMKGIILGQTGIAFGNGSTLDGRALAQTDVTLITNGVFPVELVSFTASTNNTNVNLHWSTATEVNNFGFEIERTEISNQQSAISWKKIGFVEGHGTTNAPQTYSFTDANAAGTVSYRLKQVDRDGKFEYSQSVEVSIGQTPKEFALMQNYPNPFNPATTISYQLPVNDHVSLKVYNAIGSEVATLVNDRQEAGSYTVPFNTTSGTHDLSSGVYFYRLETGSFVSTKKLILMK